MGVDEELLALDAKRSAMEKRAFELKELLCGPNMPGLTASLNTADGYPRADVDVIAAVEARHELACLNTDYNECMKLIEAKLAERR